MNQREIKFRAWDYTEKQMKYWEHFGRNDTSETAANFFGSFQDDEVEYLQFTNLKDKNGKEIYEGDIVYITFPNYQTELEIKYNEYGIHNCPPESDKLKVIGNVYETRTENRV